MSKNEYNKDNKTVETLLALTDELKDAAQRFTDKFTVSGTSFSMKEAIGKKGEVSVAIPAIGTGEVLLSLGHGLHNYPARNRDGVTTFKIGDAVEVVELANHTLYVAALNAEQQTH